MIKRGMLGFTCIFLFVFLISSVSASLILQEQPKTLYNVGDVIDFKIKISAGETVSDFFSISLVCGESESELYREYISLKPNEERAIDSKIPLNKGFVPTSTCNIKSSLGGVSVSSNSFTVSSKIDVLVKNSNLTFSPGQSVSFSGSALKENGEGVNGFVDLEVVKGDKIIQSFSDTLKNGELKVNITLIEDIPSGQNVVKFKVYEKEGEEIINLGESVSSVNVRQVPRSLELFLDKSGFLPSEKVQVKPIIHDQTGESMPGRVSISIRNSQDNLVQQYDVSSGESVSYEILGSESPSTWIVTASSGDLSSEGNFDILENKEIDIEIINNALMLTNIGNVFFNDSISVKIGNQSSIFDVSLAVGESKKYVLTAPDGYHNVEVLGGDNSFKGNVFLTGHSISAKEYSRVMSVIAHPIVWIFVIFILAGISFFVYKRVYRGSFVGKMGSKKIEGEKMVSLSEIQKDKMIKTSSPAELVLTIQGDKQDSSIVHLRIKNHEEVSKNASVCQETFSKIATLAEGNKGFIYENSGNVFVLLPPVRTKTFKNERTALNIAMHMKTLLDHHNRMFKQKIDYGLSVNQGPIVAKLEGDILKFMAVGPLLNQTKKISSISSGEVLLSEEAKVRLASEVKVEKKEVGGVVFYHIKEVRDKDPENKKFITNFVRKYEKENKK